MKKIACLAILVFSIFCTVALFADEKIPQTEFAFNLHRTIVMSQPDKNVMVSPYGVQQLLDLARLGAVGKTRTEIEKVLGYSKTVNWKTPDDGTLSNATALWIQEGYPIRPDYLQTAHDLFGASVEQADFIEKKTETLRRFNAWCSEKTKGKIPKMLDSISPDTRLILANGIHFFAKWKIPFNEGLTKNRDFTLQDGTKVETKIMSQYKKRMRYGEDADTLMLELPYQSDDYAMLLLLPKTPEAFAKWETTMTARKWNALRRTMKMEEVNMCMPRFTVEQKIALNEPLQQLGVKLAFSDKDADFSKIDGNKELYVSDVLQKAFIKVDEEGTEAAAVTAFSMSLRSADMSPPPKTFYADRPFLYAIVKGDTILFLGRFVKPEAE